MRINWTRKAWKASRERDKRIRLALANGEKTSAVALRFGVSLATVSKAKKGKGHGKV